MFRLTLNELGLHREVSLKSLDETNEDMICFLSPARPWYVREYFVFNRSIIFKHGCHTRRTPGTTSLNSQAKQLGLVWPCDPATPGHEDFPSRHLGGRSTSQWSEEELVTNIRDWNGRLCRTCSLSLITLINRAE